MLKGTFETQDGVTHENAVGLCVPLVIHTWPQTGAKAGFDFSIFHTFDALISGKKPIQVESFAVQGAAIFDFVNQCQAEIVAGANLIDSVVGKMESIVLEKAVFSNWTSYSGE